MKFVEIQYPYMPRVLTEGARIQHAEDILFWEGSAGAQRVIHSLEQMSKEGHKDVTVKWDGSPAVIFGRDEAGNFILTDKSGFTAKGYDGRSKSAEELEAMLKARKGASNPDPVKRNNYLQFVGNMTDIFPLYERAVPQDYRGFFKGDMLYFTTPELQDGQYVFKPQLVQYSVDANSELGKKIGASKTGVVIHRQVDPDGTEQPLRDPDIFQGTDVLVVPPVTAEKPVKVDTRGIDLLKRTVSKYGAQIDDLLNPAELASRQLKNLPDILYSYCNSKVDTDFSNLGADFMQWLETSKLTQRKRDNLTAYLQEHQAGFQAVWVMYNAIVKIKDDIVNKFDSQGMAVKQSIPGHGEGGEGYVLAHPEGDIKLVPREFFSKANRAVQR